ncbi:Acetyltransferase (GNAT) domain [Carpediemonas membranifera]|uniref:Acetyltransferase (GNAT) domain n=1 Tax=Carpediemonas membranifera TaxID=201153 RepID=A0A8J6AZ81_9EUKA|nr:Acetyltransferase (GNAT) domain [Carpediemonas membranifera]|eukprot:KAG9395945.1 Acetyltransferase (GNAT) domain [Carpediemonas membranifera]
MPAPYIARLVFDHHHHSFCIYRKRTEEEEQELLAKGADPDVLRSVENLVGAISFRSFPERNFIEIAFCAVHTEKRSTGVGRLMMALLKEHLKHIAREDEASGVDPKFVIKNILTYADNFAVGYFQKQGFFKRLTMDTDRHEGRIKHYDEAVLMQCDLYDHVDYLHVGTHLKVCRALILSRAGVSPISHSGESGELAVAHRQAVVDGLVTARPEMVPEMDEARLERVRQVSAALLDELTTGENGEMYRDLICPPSELPDGGQFPPGLQDTVWLGLIRERAHAGYYRTRIMLESDCTRFKDYTTFYREWMRNRPDRTPEHERYAIDAAQKLIERVRALDFDSEDGPATIND